MWKVERKIFMTNLTPELTAVKVWTWSAEKPSAPSSPTVDNPCLDGGCPLQETTTLEHGQTIFPNTGSNFPFMHEAHQCIQSRRDQT